MHASWELVLLQITVSCVLTDLFSLHPVGVKVSLQVANLLKKKPLRKFFVKLHCSSNILMQPDRICQESANSVPFILCTNMSLLTAHYNHYPLIHINKMTSEPLSRPSQHLAVGIYLHVSMHAH